MCIQWTCFLYYGLNHERLIHLFHNSTVRVMNSRVSGQYLYTVTVSHIMLHESARYYSPVEHHSPLCYTQKTTCC